MNVRVNQVLIGGLVFSGLIFSVFGIRVISQQIDINNYFLHCLEMRGEQWG